MQHHDTLTHTHTHTHTHRIKPSTQVCLIPQRCFQEHLRGGGNSWSVSYLRGEQEAAGVRRSVGLSVCSSSVPRLVRLLTSPQAALSRHWSGRQRIYSNLQGRKWHATLQKQEWKHFVFIWQWRWLQVKVTLTALRAGGSETRLRDSERRSGSSVSDWDLTSSFTHHFAGGSVSSLPVMFSTVSHIHCCSCGHTRVSIIWFDCCSLSQQLTDLWRLNSTLNCEFFSLVNQILTLILIHFISI